MMKNTFLINLWVLVALWLKLTNSASSTSAPSAFVSIFTLNNKEHGVSLSTALSAKLSSPAAEVRGPGDIFRSAASVVVGLVDDSDWRYNQETVEAYLQAFVESAIRSGRTKEVVLVYRAAALRSADALQSQLAALGETFSRIVQDIEAQEGLTDVATKSVKLSIFPIVGSAEDEQTQNDLTEFVKERLVQHSADKTTGESTVIVSPPPECSETDGDALLQCRGIEQQVLQYFVDELGALTNTTLPLSGPLKLVPVAALTQVNLHAALDSALARHQDQHARLYESGTGGYPLVLASYRTRTALVQFLSRVYLAALDQLRQSALDAFEQSSRRVPTDAKYPRKLRKRAQIVLDLFRSSSDSLTKSMRSMVQRTTAGSGLFSRSLYGQLKAQRIYPADLLEQKFTAAHTGQALQKQLAELCTEKVQGGFVSGRYNPYVRDLPFPPLRFSFNYLVSPQSLFYGLSYDKLYDEHKEGLAPNRAAPLLISGVAIPPFDPNEHPTAKDLKPWWRVLKDFFSNEL